jgi:hypothetical protein
MKINAGVQVKTLRSVTNRFREGTGVGQATYASNPETGDQLNPGFIPATAEEVELAVRLAAEAFEVYRAGTGRFAFQARGWQRCFLPGTLDDLSRNRLDLCGDHTQKRTSLAAGNGCPREYSRFCSAAVRRSRQL